MSEIISNPVFVKKDGTWFCVSQDEYNEKESSVGDSVYYYDESRSLETVLEQFGTVEAFWDYVNQ